VNSSLIYSAALLRGERQHPRRSRSRGYYRKSRGSFRFPAPTKLHRLEENIGALEIELMPDDLREIESAASTIQVQGARYPERLEQMTGR